MKPGSEPGFESSWCLFLTTLISLNVCFGSEYRILHLEENHDTRRHLYFPVTPKRRLCRLQTVDCADHADWVFFPFFSVFFGEILISRNTNNNKQDRRSPQNVDCRLSIFFTLVLAFTFDSHFSALNTKQCLLDRIRMFESRGPYQGAR